MILISPEKFKSLGLSAGSQQQGKDNLQNACMLFLVRSSLEDLKKWQKCLGLLKNYFWDAHPYPIIAFIEQDFLDSWQTDILSMGMAVEFVVVNFQIPSHLPAETVPEDVHGFGLGYRHMCQFFSMGVYEHPRLQSFEYYWRLDTDSFLLSPVPYDVFALMHEEALVYGHINTLEEVHDQADVVEGLWGATLDYARDRQLPVDSLQNLCDENGNWRRGIYYTNFEISRFDWWRSEPVRGYLEYLNQLGGIYRQRWGDAPIHTLAVTLLAPPSKVHLFTEIDYCHQDVVIRFEAEAEPWCAPEHLFENRNDLKAVFTTIYEKSIWGGGSGGGSVPDAAAPYLRLLQDFIHSNGIRTIVDLGCGDWQLHRHLDLTSVNGYLGIDVVESVIQENTQNFGTAQIRFECADIVEKSQTCPSADLCVIKDVLQRLSDANVLRILEALNRFRYVIITNDYTLVNGPCGNGDTRPLNLREAPFHLCAADVLRFGNKQSLLVVDPGGSRRLTGAFAENSRPGNGWLNWQPSNFGSGLGDRLRSIATMMVVAELQGKLLRMFWLPNQYCPGNVMEVLESSALEIITGQREWDRLTTGQEKETGFMLHHTMDNVWEVHGENFRARGETPHSMNTRWQRMIRRIRIRHEMVRKVDMLRSAWGRGRLLGVHIRRTDVLEDSCKPINADNMAAFDSALLDKAQERAAAGLIDGFFLACDNAISAAAWREMLEALGLPVFQYQKTWRPEQLRQTSLEDAIIDLCLLSRCDGIIGSVYSSFAVVAASMGSTEYETVPPPPDLEA